MLNASAAFKTHSGKVFKEDVDIMPVIIDETLSYVPWGGDNGKCPREMGTVYLVYRIPTKSFAWKSNNCHFSKP